MLRREGRVLLEYRPAAGIWGGLLGLPELPTGESAGTYALRTFGCKLGTVQALAPLHHGFTHFDLELRPLLCEVKGVRPAARQDGPIWLAPQESEEAPLPAPVRKLLAALDD